MCKEINLSISFGDIYEPRTLTGTCHTKHQYAVEAADPGIYEAHLVRIRYDIPRLLEQDFIEFFDFVDWRL